MSFFFLSFLSDPHSIWLSSAICPCCFSERTHPFWFCRLTAASVPCPDCFNTCVKLQGFIRCHSIKWTLWLEYRVAMVAVLALCTALYPQRFNENPSQGPVKVSHQISDCHKLPSLMKLIKTTCALRGEGKVSQRTCCDLKPDSTGLIQLTSYELGWHSLGAKDQVKTNMFSACFSILATVSTDMALI